MSVTTAKGGPGYVSPNYIINGAFDIWQRGTSFASPSSYNSDRWTLSYSSTFPTTWEVTRQAFTPADLQALGYGEGQFFYRHSVTTAADSNAVRIVQHVEDVRTLAGQTVTISGYFKSNTPVSIAPRLIQFFGSGGSAAVTNIIGSAFQTTTNWQRFSVTGTLPSISGKTIGAGSSLALWLQFNRASGQDLDIWGVQLEAGSVATPFRRNANSLQGELAACQRYYQRVGRAGGIGTLQSTTVGFVIVPLKVTMRAAPTVSPPADLTNAVVIHGVGFRTPTFATNATYLQPDSIRLDLTGMAASTIGFPISWYGTTTQEIQVSAEL